MLEHTEKPFNTVAKTKYGSCNNIDSGVEEDGGGTGNSSSTVIAKHSTAIATTVTRPVHQSERKINPCANSSITRSENKYKTEDSKLPLCFLVPRHQESIEGIICETQSWRIRERMKTVSVALVLCLNIGVDPPDIVKIQPCARLECWVDPSSVSPAKAMELIGANLQKQYERWQPRARYKKFHDPTVEDVKKLCTSLRRNAKEERVLFHYNGHGVPRPTTNGEIWVFNKTYTQYIPLSIYDLQTWMGAPSIYVYDCSNAGIIVNSFNQFAEQHEREMEQTLATSVGSGGAGPRQSSASATAGAASVGPQLISYKNCIQLAACSGNQILPMNPKLPADLFTSCLTTPIKIALKWYTMQRTAILVPHALMQDLIEKIPGQLNDRRTMLGELNWIFTAITDTIAWNTLPRELFQKLFRQDLLVASLFRNFLLAERILRSYDCVPISSPPLPQGFRHPMWAAWDLAVDLALQQLPDILENGVAYKQIPFFEEQLTAFQVWLDRASEQRSPPEQLPIVLQVLLSQVHRLRALELLGRFLELGPWAVNLALGVGIFPYVLKLLQSSAKELRPVLVFIWAKILAVDSSCQVDLVKDHKYFLSVLQDTTVSQEHRTLSAFVLASIVNNFPLGQTSALQGSLISISLLQISDDSYLLRQWLTICLGQLWQNFAKARWSGVRDLAHEKLYMLLQDPVPEVRAAAVFALGTYVSSVTERSEHANNIDRFIAMTLLTTVGEDMSPLVRLELVGALQWMVIIFESQFVSVYLQDSVSVTGHATTSIGGHQTIHANTTHSLERNINMKRVFSSSSIPTMSTSASGSFTSTSTIGFGSIYMKLWQGIVNLGRDPYPKVAEAAARVIDFVRNQAVGMIAAKEAASEKYGLASLSLPPSPNTRTTYLSESPPHSQDQIVIQHATAITVAIASSKATSCSRNMTPKRQNSVGKLRKVSINNDEIDSFQPVPSTPGIKQSSAIITGGPREESVPGLHPQAQSAMLKPLVATKFIPWSISYFSRSATKISLITAASTDPHSSEYRARQWRFFRNDYIRKVSREQQLRAIFHRIDTQNWIGKTQFTPSIVKLLPYEQQIAAAYLEKVSVHDWSRGTFYSYIPQPTAYNFNTTVVVGSTFSSASSHAMNSSVRKKHPITSSAPLSTTSRVTAVEFVNSHDSPMVLAGYEDGMVRIWQEPPPGRPNNETKLVTAWQALPPSNKMSKDMCGLVETWQQRSQHLCVGGYSRALRLWDAERELKVCDIPTGSESSVRVLSSSSIELIAAGCSDGSVRVFDKRCPPQESRIMTYREHSGAIIATCLRDNCESLVSGCSQGKIRLYDIRSHASVQSWSAGGDVSAIAIHSGADIVACGAQNISIFGFDGRHLTTLRNHEGFMGQRISHTSCLSFHPHKVVLAAGFVDNTVAVYAASGNNRI